MQLQTPELHSLPLRPPPGTGQNGFGLNWGNGFITDLDIIRNRGLSDANPFFRELLKKPYVNKVRMGDCTRLHGGACACSCMTACKVAHAWSCTAASLLHQCAAWWLAADTSHPIHRHPQVVITPHVYPPTITHATFLGTTLWDQCRTSFGYLQTKGYCAAPGDCKKFPVLIGETGSAFETATDKQWLNDFADFCNAEVRERGRGCSLHACDCLKLAAALRCIPPCTAQRPNSC